MIKKSTSWSVLIYGLLLVGLGYLGYHAGSIISLYMGAGFGALLILSSFFMFANQKFGSYTALILALILTVTFGIRYSMTSKAVPAILAILSGAMLLFLLAQTATWRK